MWFWEDAGRAGFSGFLGSNRVPGNDASKGGNEWLLSNATKTLVGYPVEGIPLDNQGRMHATPPFDVRFVSAGGTGSHTYKTRDILGLPGNSGGPLCVLEQGAYYPAAIYVGGSSGQTVVRSIDGDVVALFNRADAEGNGGDNSVGGGITLTGTESVGSGAGEKGGIRVLIEPEAARVNGAAWRFSDEAYFLFGDGRSADGSIEEGSGRLDLEPRMVTLEFKTIPEFLPPISPMVMIEAGELKEFTYTYESSAEREAWRVANFGADASADISGDTADPDGDGAFNNEEFTLGTNPNVADSDGDGVSDGVEINSGTDPLDFGDSFKVNVIGRAGAVVTLSVESGKKGRIYELQRYESPIPGSANATGGWRNIGIQGPLGADGRVTLIDSASLPDGAIYRVKVSVVEDETN